MLSISPSNLKWTTQLSVSACWWKRILRCHCSITTQIFRFFWFSLLGEVRIWGGPVEVTGAEASGEWQGRGQRCRRSFGGKKHQCGVWVVCEELLRPWLRLSLHERCCKAVLDGGVDVSQTGLRVFGFLNGPVRFEVGALRRIRAGGRSQSTFYTSENVKMSTKKKQPQYISCHYILICIHLCMPSQRL